MDYYWIILSVILGGFVVVSLMTQVMNRNPL
jgi:hypothetical protein